MIGSQIRTLVRERAQNACEYCHLHQDDSPLAALHVEHVIPKVHGGADDSTTLRSPASIAIYTRVRTSPESIRKRMN
jgi:hypothetical protein